MSLALGRLPATGTSATSLPDAAEQKLNISVVFTSREATLAALREAGTLANSLGTGITLIVPQIVPRPLPLEAPPVLRDFSEERFRAIATDANVETSVRIYLCRDRFETLAKVLSPGALVILGGRKSRWSWWPTRDERLARQLLRTGSHVIFKETE